MNCGRIIVVALLALLPLAGWACSDHHNLAGDAADDAGEDGAREDGRDVPPLEADAETSVDGELPDGTDDGPGTDADGTEAETVGDVFDVDVVLPPAACGDGVVDPGEECDDMNRMNGDGCDWLCRVGDGSFAYPPPDPDVPPLAADGAPTPVNDFGETTTWALGDGFPFCGGLRLAWTGRFFGLVYNVDQPYFGVHLRFLNRDGTEASAPWRHDTPWQIWNHAPAWSGAELALFSGNARDGMALSRFDDLGRSVAEFSPIRGPDPRDPTAEAVQYLSDATWGGDRYLVVSPWTYPLWSLETFGPAGDALAAVLVDPGREGRSCIRALRVPGGWAVTNGWYLAILDATLAVAAYSGQLGAARPDSASAPIEGARVVDVGDGLVVVWMAGMGEGWDWRWALWMAGLSYSGEMTWPPRPVAIDLPIVRDAVAFPSMTGGEGWAGWATASGPAGIAVVAWIDRDGGTVPGGELRVMNTDRFGNIVSGPVAVLAEGQTTSHGYALDIAADDTGYGIVAVEDGPTSTTGRIVYRHFVPAE